MGSRDRNATVAIAGGMVVHLAAAVALVTWGNLASLATVFAAVPGGLATGLLTDRYGSELRHGAVAAGIALGVVAVVTAGYGLQQSLAMGYGWDSVVSFVYGAYAIVAVPFFLPVALAEGTLAAAAGNAIRLRLRSADRTSTR